MSARVLFVHHSAALGGSELHLAAVAAHFRETSAVVLFDDGPLAERLRHSGVEVRVIASAWAPQGIRGGAPRLTPANALSVLRLAAGVARQARAFGLIYANSPKSVLVASLAGRLACRPVLWAVHDLFDPAHFSRGNIGLLLFASRCGVGHIVTCSEASAAELMKRGVPARKVSTVYNGIDPAAFPAEVETVTLRSELGLNEGPVAGVFGRITEWKGQHIAIEMLCRVPGLQLLVVGEPEDRDYQEALRRRADELGVADRVRWLGYRDDVGRLMALTNLVLHTSVAPEPFGRVVVEAMFAGRPVIATSGGGIPEIVEDGVNGVLVPPGDADALAKLVLELLRDPVRAAALASTGRERALKRFRLDTMLAAMTSQIEALGRT